MRSSSVASLLAAVALVATACVSPRREPPRVPRGEEAVRLPPRLDHRSQPRRVALARSLVGSAYRYGGATPSGFDCSGLVQYVFESDGLRLPRTTLEQAEAGRWVALDELDAGDLVFFADGGGKPHHVGVVVSAAGQPLRMIHASTSEGVVETDVFASDYWTHRLRFGRRVDRALR